MILAREPDSRSIHCYMEDGGIVTRDGWKYVCTPNNDWLLHNTIDDPYEQANYCYDVEFQSNKEHCHSLLADWITRTGDVFELPNIALPVE